jgi:MFS family permease
MLRAMSAHAASDTVTTRIPARMDRLPWTTWHWRIIIALGTVWILDGLEVTIVGSISARLQEKETLGLTAYQATAQGSIYVAGACVGAVLFGILTDRLGRKKLFLWTLSLYLVATIATAFTGSFWTFAICRFFTGMGIGGEYAAVNSAIDELIPARVRGWADLVINGSFWIGTAGAAALSVLLLSDALPTDLGWRLTFGAGALMALLILFVRRTLPESPRWLLTHGRADEADRIVEDIEGQVREQAGGGDLPEPEGDPIAVHQRTSIGFGVVARTMVQRYPRRLVLGLALMGAQAFAFNAVLFSFATILTKQFGVGDASVGWYLLPFALVNFLGPLLLGRFFDTVGRRPMIGGTYAIAGLLLAGTALLFNGGSLTAWTFVLCLCAAFFFASAGASAGYLTVSEVFPMEIRAMAIAFFYAVATALGGITGPALFGRLVDSPGQLTVGFLIAAGLMLIAAVVEFVLGIDAEGEALEDIAKPLTAEAAEGDEAAGAGRRDGAAARPRPAPPRTATSQRGNRFSRPGWSPSPVASTRPREDRDLGRETAAIAAALAQADGPIDRRALAAAVGARYWGAGRFSLALAAACADGTAQRVGRARYAAGAGTPAGDAGSRSAF